jgi:hypothetical protein
MDDLRTRAQLVAFDGAGAIGTVVTRAEVTEAAAGPEFPATLHLDLDRVEAADGGEITAHATLAVDWDRETLERLLASTDDDEIGLWFDERELAQAFEADVEGHGFRQRAAVIAVAVAAVGATAAPASARLAAGNEGGGGGTPAAAAVAPAAGAERGLQQDEQIAPAPAHRATAGFSVDPAAGGQGPVVQSAGAERGLLQDEQIAVTHDHGTGAAPAVTSTGDATLSSGELAAAVAGGALLIAAAGFGAARRRTPPAQPA